MMGEFTSLEPHYLHGRRWEFPMSAPFSMKSLQTWDSMREKGTLGSRQVVRHSALDAAFGGSNPSSPANRNSFVAGAARLRQGDGGKARASLFALPTAAFSLCALGAPCA